MMNYLEQKENIFIKHLYKLFNMNLMINNNLKRIILNHKWNKIKN